MGSQKDTDRSDISKLLLLRRLKPPLKILLTSVAAVLLESLFSLGTLLVHLQLLDISAAEAVPVMVRYVCRDVRLERCLLFAVRIALDLESVVVILYYSYLR